MKTRLFSGLAMALFLMLGVAKHANAQTQTCGNGPVSGASVTIRWQGPGDCVIDGDVTATSGTVEITSTGGIVITGSATASGDVDLEANNQVEVDSGITASAGQIYITAENQIYLPNSIQSGTWVNLTGSSIEVDGTVTTGSTTTAAVVMYADQSTSNGTIKVTQNITAPGHPMVFAAGGDISLQQVSNYSGPNIGDIRIFANLAGGTDAFVVGGSGSPVNGAATLTATSDTGTAPPEQNPHKIYITNGPNGNVEIADASQLQVWGNSAQSGSILVDTQGGNLLIDSGDLDVSGGQYSAGIIGLRANQIITGSGVQLTATSNSGAGLQHKYIQLATSQVSYTGGLWLDISGDGDSTGPSNITIATEGSYEINAPQSPELVITSPYVSGNNKTPVTIESTDGQTLDLIADGINTQIVFGGYPVTFTGLSQTGDVYMSASGTNTSVLFGFDGSATGNTSLSFAGGNVQVYADSTAAGVTAGTVTVSADRLAVTAASVSLNANAETGNANAGQITVTAAGGGTVPLGMGADAMALVAIGGPGGGNGGSVTVTDQTGTVTVDSTSLGSLNANPSNFAGTNGNGGSISINAQSLTNSGASTIIQAYGSGTGPGGSINVQVTDDMTIGGGNNQVSFYAQAAGTGNGGSITINTGGNLTFDPWWLWVGAGSSGNGGTMKLTSSGAMQITPIDWYDLDASAGTTQGMGGTINMYAGGNLTASGGTVLITSFGYGTGAGGNISMHGAGNLSLDSNNNDFEVEAAAQGTGSGGSITVSSGADLTFDPYWVWVGAGSNGNGGTIDLSASGNLQVTPIDATTMDASAGVTQGNGGTILLTADDTLSTSGNLPISANGNGTGDGGSVILSSGGSLLIDGTDDTAFQISATSLGSQGSGGDVHVTSTGDAIVVSGVDIDVNAGVSNGKGGLIELSANTGLTLTGDLSAKGAGNGGGGYISLDGETVSLGAGTIDDSAGDTGTFSNTINPNILIDSKGTGDLIVPTGSVIRSLAGTSAPSGSRSGNITLFGGGSLTGSGIVVDGTISAANSAASGVGGRISLASASGLTVNGQITASAGASGGIGGTITLAYTDSSGDKPITIAAGGSVNADQPAYISGSVGTVTISNSASANANVGASVAGLLSANNGLIDVVSLNELSAEVQGEGQVVGAFLITNAQNVIIDMGTGSVTIDDIQAAGDVSITTANGDILSDGTAPITGSQLELESTGGNIGTLGGQSLLTAVGTLTVTANFSTTTAQNVNISNSSQGEQSLLLNNSAASGSFSLTTNNSLFVNSVTAGLNSSGTNFPGNLSLVTTGGENITILSTEEAQAAVYSYGGNLSIISNSSSTTLVVQPYAEIVAVGIKNVSTGIVLIEMGTPVGLISFTDLPYFQLTIASLAPQVSSATPPFTANAPVSNGSVLNSQMVIYGATSGNITFQGGNHVTAITPN